MQLEGEQRRLLNTCVARARAHERQQLTAEAEALRAEIARERDEMYAKLAELRASIIGEYVEMCNELARVRKEAALLREWKQAHTEHQRARHELLALYRRRMLEAAWEAERDPALPLQ